MLREGMGIVCFLGCTHAANFKVSWEAYGLNAIRMIVSNVVWFMFCCDSVYSTSLASLLFIVAIEYVLLVPEIIIW